MREELLVMKQEGFDEWAPEVGIVERPSAAVSLIKNQASPSMMKARDSIASSLHVAGVGDVRFCGTSNEFDVLLSRLFTPRCILLVASLTLFLFQNDNALCMEFVDGISL